MRGSAVFQTSPVPAGRDPPGRAVQDAICAHDGNDFPQGHSRTRRLEPGRVPHPVDPRDYARHSKPELNFALGSGPKPDIENGAFGGRNGNDTTEIFCINKKFNNYKYSDVWKRTCAGFY